MTDEATNTIELLEKLAAALRTETFVLVDRSAMYANDVSTFTFRFRDAELPPNVGGERRED